MQIEAGQNQIESAEPPAYPTHIKDRALKILLDYQEVSGRKWQRICSEILKTTDAPATPNAPILTRQDLEAWEKRRTILGDGKFKWVFAFLTHPETLNRAEFARARDLITAGQLERIGGAISDFYSDVRNSGLIKRTPAARPLSSEVIESRLGGFEGCFVGHKEGADYCLSLKRYPGESYFVAHFLTWPTQKAGDPSDWETERWSGFCTVGNQMRLHLRGVVVRAARDMQLTPVFGDAEQSETNTFTLITNELTVKAIEHLNFGNFTAAHRKLRFLDPQLYSIELSREDDPDLDQYIDQFRWNIVL